MSLVKPTTPWKSKMVDSTPVHCNLFALRATGSHPSPKTTSNRYHRTQLKQKGSSAEFEEAMLTLETNRQSETALRSSKAALSTRSKPKLSGKKPRLTEEATNNEVYSTDFQKKMTEVLVKRKLRKCAYKGDITKMLQLWDVMEQTGSQLISAEKIRDRIKHARRGENEIETSVQSCIEQLSNRVSQLSKVHRRVKYQHHRSKLLRQLMRIAVKFQQLLDVMADDGIQISTMAYNSLLRAYSSGNETKSAAALLVSMRDHGPPPNLSSYVVVIDGFATSASSVSAAEDFNNCMSVIRDAKTDGLLANPRLHSSLFKICKKGRLVREALDLFEQMRMEGIRLDVVIYNMVINVLAQSCTIETAVDTFNRYQALMGEMSRAAIRPDFMTYAAALKICAQGRLVDKAVLIMEEMREKNIQPSNSCYRTLFNTYAQSADVTNAAETFEKCQNLLDDMAAEGVEPDSRTCSSLLDIYVKNGSFKDALAILKDLQSKGVQITAVIYNMLINAYVLSVEDNEITEALKKCRSVIADMDAGGLKSTKQTYINVLRLCIRGSLLSTARSLLNEMREKGLSPNLTTYNAFLKVHAACATQANAMKILGQCHAIINTMKSEGFRPNTATYNVLLKLCARGGLLDEADKVHAAMGPDGVPHNVIAYNTLMSVYIQPADVENASEILTKCRGVIDDMRSNGLNPDDRSYGLILKLCSKGKMADTARAIFDEMCREGIQPSIIHYSTLTDIYAGCGASDAVTKCHRLFDEMRREGVEPTVATYSSLLKAYGLQGRIDEALAVFDEMRERNVQPSFICFYTCFKYALIMEKREFAPLIYERMKEFGLTYATVPSKLRAIMKALGTGAGT